MARRRRVQTVSYRAYGGGIYAPAYDGNAVRAAESGEVLQPKPRVRRKQRVLTRTRVKVRPAGQASPVTVLGFLLVGVVAALMLMSCAQYAVLADQVVSLRGELSTLQSENATLSAEYEKVFDLERIQNAVGGTMVRPSSGQIEYIDLSAPDSVELYGGGSGNDVWEEIRDAFAGVLEFFR